MSRPSRVPRRRAPLVPLAVLVWALAGCGASSAAAGPVASPTPTTTLAPAPTHGPSPTATSAPVLCGNTPLPTPPAGGPVAAGQFNGWDGVPALAGTLIYADDARASDGVSVSISSESLGLCTPSATPAAVTSFYVTRLPANGWATSATPPQGAGANFQSCAGGACWQRAAGNGTTVYVALDAVRAAGGATLYTLTRLDVHTN